MERKLIWNGARTHCWCFSWGLSKKCAPFSGLKAPEEQAVCCWQSQAGLSMGDGLARAVFPGVSLEKNWWRCCSVVSRGSQSHLPWLDLPCWFYVGGCRPPLLRFFFIICLFVCLFSLPQSDPFWVQQCFSAIKGSPDRLWVLPERGTQQTHPMISWG